MIIKSKIKLAKFITKNIKYKYSQLAKIANK